jgi:hypothetical protein
MELRHFIEGSSVEEPVGWGEFTEDIKRNYKLRLIGTEYPIDVTFIGGGYKFLFDLYEENPCAIVSYRVDQQCGDTWEVALRAAIFLSDIEWNLDKCEAKVKPMDDGIGARINNNKGVDVYPTAEVTKSGEPLAPLTAIDLELFDPQAAVGTYLPDTRKVYDWKACLEQCVSYITDLNVTIVSDWYDSLPDNERWAVIDG